MDPKSLVGRSLGIYEIGPELGRGGMGTVYRAKSRAAGPAGDAGAVVALKVFQPELIADERTFERFQREAELGIRIRHPNVVRTYEIAKDELAGTPYHYMAMELVEGQTLRDLLGDIGALPEHLVYLIADQALAALGAIHAEGMIHRDIKPDNLVVTRENRVLLMDLGIARLQQHGRDLTRAGEFVGSLHYAAPEQFTDQDNVGAMADLYSFGLVLYEMTTGKNPFGTADLNTLIALKLKDQVRRPRTLERDLDPFLDDVILTCLNRDPKDRFASCEDLRQVLREGERSAWWRTRIQGESYPASIRALKRLRPARGAPLVGRGGDLDRLHAAYTNACAQGGRLALVRGSAGSGKSRVVHDFAEELVAPGGPLVLAGRCDDEAEGPAHAFVQAFRDFLGDPAGFEARLGELLPEMRGTVPDLARYLRGEKSDIRPEALASVWPLLLRNLASERPLILVLEDLGRASAGTVDLFGNLARSFAGHPILLVGTYRQDEVEEGSPLHAAATALAQRPETTTCTLGPLSRDVADELVRSQVVHERTVRALGRPLFEKSEGNPRILLEMLAQLTENGTLAASEGGLVLTRKVEDVELPASIRDLAVGKLAELDEGQRETLDAAAVIGPEFEAPLLAALTGQKRIRLLQRLALLERKHRLVASAGKDAFRFASRGLYHVVYDGIPEERRRELHGECAEAIREGWEDEAQAPARESFAFVRHLLDAGSVLPAGLQVPPAARYAAERLHPAGAAAFLERLLAALAQAPVAERFDICMSLVRLYATLGQPEDRMRAIERASEEAARTTDPAAFGRVHAGRAAALWSVGRYDEAEAEARRGLALAWDAKDRGVEADCLHTLGAIAYRRGDFTACVAHWHDALEHRRAAGDRRGEAATLQALGSVMPEIGEGDLALARKQEALAIFREIGDRRGEGAAINNVGNSYVDAHKVDEALACYEQAAAIARECGDLPSEASALFNRGRTLAMQAQIEDAKETFTRALDLFREIRDPGGEAEVLDEMGSAIATYGEIGEALRCLEEARRSAESTGQRALLSRVLRHLANLKHDDGERDAAWDLYDRALAMAGDRGRLQIFADMGHAALKEGSFDASVRYLEASISDLAGRNRTLLSLCRLARAHKAAGRNWRAREYGVQAETVLTEVGGVPSHHGPEIYYSLGSVLEDTDRGPRYMARANELVGQRTRSIQSIVHRQHYLTMTWPNREILEEARKLL